jgi:hypothetical protein
MISFSPGNYARKTGEGKNKIYDGVFTIEYLEMKTIHYFKQKGQDN